MKNGFQREPNAASPAIGPEDEFGAVLTRFNNSFTGDPEELRQRGFIRVLVSHSKSNFFYAGGHPRGFEVDLFRQFEQVLNQGKSLRHRVRIVFVTVPFDQLLDDLRDGRGDITRPRNRNCTRSYAQIKR